MNAHPAPHPTDPTLHSYGLGQLDDASAGLVNAHLEGCPDCRRRVAEFSSDSFLGRFRDAQARPESLAPVFSSVTGRSGQAGERRPPVPSATGAPPPGLADHPDYEILRELGRSSTGVVYLAQNRLMGRQEVLKVVSGRLVNRSDVLDRFLAGIRNAARLHHPNIVTAYSALRVGEDLVLAMEYVEGLDLARMVAAKGPLPVANACIYAHQAALGLQHAHEQGVVHHNIKPGNLMLARSGNRAVVKILGFGLTPAGQMLGTPDYIAPEQTTDPRRADRRADIYSLGCSLYYLLTGHPPFQGANLYDILQAHQSMEALPLNVARPEVPLPLAIIVATMMAKDPERRFQLPQDVSRALAPFIKKDGASPRGSPPEIPRTAGASGFQLSQATGGAAPRPSAEAPEASPTPREEPTAPDQPAAGWEIPIEIHEDADLSKEVRGLREARAPRAWQWPAAAGVLVLLGLAAALGPSLVSRMDPAKGLQPEAPAASSRKAAPPTLTKRPIEPTLVRGKSPAPPAATPTATVARTPPPPKTALASNVPSGRRGRIDRPRPPAKSLSDKGQPEASTRDRRPIEETPKAKPTAAPPPPPEDESPEAILERCALKKSGTYYVLEAEREYNKVWNTNVQPAINLMEGAWGEWAAAIEVEILIQDLEATQAGLVAYLNNLSVALSQANRVQRPFLLQDQSATRMNLNNVQAQLGQARRQRRSPAQMEALKAEFMRRREAFQGATNVLEPVYKNLKNQYSAIDDDKVKNALAVLSARYKAKFHLGPSESIQRTVRTLNRYLEMVSFNPDSYRASRKKSKSRSKGAPKAESRKAGEAP
jgi:serine/threonine protein kinase